MIEYYLLFLIPAFLALSYKIQFNLTTADLNGHSKPAGNINSWIIVGFIFIICIGFRHEVGGDWGAYLRHFKLIEYYTFYEVLTRSDPGYYLINWLMKDWGFEIYSVNLICGIIFTLGLIIFCRQQPNPWLALCVAIPYLIIVVAMGYTRQAVAIGFVFWSIAALRDNEFKKFLILVALAATFHKSAVLMIGLGLFLQGNGKFLRTLSVLLVGVGIYNAFLADYQEGLWKNYVEANMQSQGAYIRVAMNFLPASIFLIFRKSWKNTFRDYTFWLIIALGSITSIFVVGLAPTAVDRVSLYFTPIQIVVFARLPYLLKDRLAMNTTTWAIVLFYLLVLYVWLNYATHARYWLPYQNALFKDVFG